LNEKKNVSIWNDDLIFKMIELNEKNEKFKKKQKVTEKYI